MKPTAKPGLDKTVFHGVDRQTMILYLRSQCSPQSERYGYIIGPDAEGRFSHCSTHFTLAEAVRKAKEMNHGKTSTPEVFASTVNPEWSVSVYSDIRYGLRGAGYHLFRTSEPDKILTPGDVDYLAGTSVVEELKAVGNFVAWGT
jgi:hypothetical protein